MIDIKLKAQSMSIDVSLGVVIFIAAFFIFYSVLNANPNKKAINLKEEASTVIKQITSEDALLRVVDNNEINESRLDELKNLNYDDLKRKLRIEDDFCIYIENEKGYVVLINNSYRGIGSQTINLSGIPCSQK